MDPVAHLLVERRVARADGTVLLFTEYDYKEGGNVLIAEEIEARMPGRGRTMSIRFGDAAVNTPIPPERFRWFDTLP